MRELLIATTNKGKLREIRDMLEDDDILVTSLHDYSGLPRIVEDGKTFRDNAIKKAVTIARHTGKLTMGEDSGIEVKVLGNKPGVYSARFSGPGATDEKNNKKLLRLLSGVPASKRQACYRCFMALADKDGVVAVVDGKCSGLIAAKPAGTNGFGYDPLFVVPRYGKTFGELDPSVKSKISHRARALKKLWACLKRRKTDFFPAAPVIENT
ncbi:MAG: XTP/dITP diphosphatase [Candidatus Omnitrophota bacterium]|nr:XTP/dITP diphosphatase [Candidatus Omnitrophota bacterium]MDZ4241883.1 XTP/dITP diphosphatase [Candidatus Omnitrophota bacterium]